MEMPSESGVPSIADVYKAATARSGLLKIRAQDLITRSLAGPLPLADVGDFATLLADGNDVFTQAIAMGTAIDDFAKVQARDATLEFVTKATALQTAIGNVRTWINTNYPRATAGSPLFFSGALQEHTFDANFRRVKVTLTTGQASGLRTQLATITAAIT